MTVTESVFLAPGEVLDTAGVDLPLSIMHNFKQELASRGLFFFFLQSAEREEWEYGSWYLPAMEKIYRSQENKGKINSLLFLKLQFRLKSLKAALKVAQYWLVVYICFNLRNLTNFVAKLHLTLV